MKQIDLIVPCTYAYTDLILHSVHHIIISYTQNPSSNYDKDLQFCKRNTLMWRVCTLSIHINTHRHWYIGLVLPCVFRCEYCYYVHRHSHVDTYTYPIHGPTAHMTTWQGENYGQLKLGLPEQPSSTITRSDIACNSNWPYNCHVHCSFPLNKRTNNTAQSSPSLSSIATALPCSCATRSSSGIPSIPYISALILSLWGRAFGTCLTSSLCTCEQWMASPGAVYSFLWQMWHLKCFAFWW